MEGVRRQPGAVAVAATVAAGGVVAVLVVLASSAGSVHPVSPSTRSAQPLGPPPVGSGPTPSETPPPPTPYQGWARDQWQLPAWLGTLVDAALLTALAVVVFVLLRLAVRKAAAVIREVRMPPPAFPQDAVGGERVISAERLAAAVGTGLEAVAAGTPSNAIVACWQALERAAAGAGVERRPAETPSEFTVRVLAAADVSQPRLERLAELYREARFSQHDLPETARAEAREALVVLRDQLVSA